MVRGSQGCRTVPHGGITPRLTDSPAAAMGDMEQLTSTWRSPDGSLGALLRAGRRRALLSQEQLAARAGLSERTVRDVEAGRVRSPRDDTVRLLADALQLSGPQRESWFAAARDMHHPHTDPRVPGAGGPARQLTAIPAQPPLSARGFGEAGQPRRCCPFTGQSQAETTELYRRENRQIGQAGQNVDLIATTLRARASQAEADAGTGHDSELTNADRRELAELRRENRRLREDVQILKRATAIFATAARPARVHQGRRPGHRRGPIR